MKTLETAVAKGPNHIGTVSQGDLRSTGIGGGLVAQCHLAGEGFDRFMERNDPLLPSPEPAHRDGPMLDLLFADSEDDRHLHH